MEDTGLHFIRFSARHRAAGGHFTRSDGVQCPSAPKPARSGPGNGLPWTQPSVVFGAHADLGGRRGPSAPKGLVYSPAGVPGRSIRAKLRKSNSDWRETSRRPWQLGAEWRERERDGYAICILMGGPRGPLGVGLFRSFRVELEVSLV